MIDQETFIYNNASSDYAVSNKTAILDREDSRKAAVAAVRIPSQHDVITACPMAPYVSGSTTVSRR